MAKTRIGPRRVLPAAEPVTSADGWTMTVYERVADGSGLWCATIRSRDRVVANVFADSEEFVRERGEAAALALAFAVPVVAGPLDNLPDPDEDEDEEDVMGDGD